MIECLIWLFVSFLCWGSFLNVVAYRLTYDKPFFTKRSYCPSCNKIISWFDNIPVISYLLLMGKCRSCKAPISYLYPFVELLSGMLLTSMYYFYPENFVAYFIFFSALIVGIRTDLEAMVIPQLCSIWLAPLGVLFSFLGMTRVSLIESLLGAALGYGILWLVATIFRYATKRDGLGVGDMELLAMIGAFLGPLGAWFSLLVGSLSGLLAGGIYISFLKSGRNTRIPFGPFLALGAIVWFFFGSFGLV